LRLEISILLHFDKLPVAELRQAVQTLRPRFPAITLVAAGGLTGANIQSFAETRIDVLATTWPYFGTPADIEVTLTTSDTALAEGS
jgi:molybdenum transport protein